MNGYRPLEVRVWGEFACFTRPELKVERVSYAVMTPSAARGVLEAIFWKPQFQWRVTEIAVLRPIRYFSILRNEVNSKASLVAGRRRVDGGAGYYAEEDRAQRHSLILRDVAYRVRAEIVAAGGVEEDAAKFRDQFRRRVNRGQCWHTPYLGCREFSASFSASDEHEEPIDHSEDLGVMLFDLDYGSHDGTQPRFFEARLDRGVLHVPPQLYTSGAQ